MTNEEIHHSLLLNNLPGLGPGGFSLLIQAYGSASAAAAAGPAAWVGLGLRAEVSDDNFEAARCASDEEAAYIQENQVGVLLFHEGPYPALLRQIASPPPVLYVKGEDITADRAAVALVGSRRSSYYGESVAKKLSAELARYGVTTVSGLARGIDTRVHMATMEAGGRTWAVLGSGLGAIYPPENRKLAARIETAGAVISEFPIFQRPFPSNFPRRNRIIAGLSVGTVLVEGREASGGLITACLAADQGREVFAVPGPITSPLSAAPHRMLMCGAKLVRHVEDILEELPGWNFELSTSVANGPAGASALSAEQARILELAAGEPVTREWLAERMRLTVQELSPVLLELEMKGRIRSAGGKIFAAEK